MLYIDARAERAHGIDAGGVEKLCVTEIWLTVGEKMRLEVGLTELWASVMLRLFWLKRCFWRETFEFICLCRQCDPVGARWHLVVSLAADRGHG